VFLKLFGMNEGGRMVGKVSPPRGRAVRRQRASLERAPDRRLAALVLARQLCHRLPGSVTLGQAAALAASNTGQNLARYLRDLPRELSVVTNSRAVRQPRSFHRTVRSGDRVAALPGRRLVATKARPPEAGPAWGGASRSEARRPIDVRGRCGSKPRRVRICCA
jgi:hypothetical protein